MKTKIVYNDIKKDSFKETKKFVVFLLNKNFEKQIKSFGGEDYILKILKEKNFKGMIGNKYLTNTENKRILYIGTHSKNEELNVDSRFVGNVIAKIAQQEDYENISLFSTDEIINDIRNIVQAIVLKSYIFDKYKSKKQIKNIIKIEIFSNCKKQIKDQCKGIIDIAQAVFIARDLMNEPPNVLYPGEYAKRVKNIFDGTKVKVKVLGEKEIKKYKMGSLYAVGQGSRKESKVVIMEYTPLKTKNISLALVGKGVTFDTGGISIKPSTKMDEMKFDMGGSAACVGAIYSAQKQKLPMNIVSVIGLVENMPDGDAYRPGDILTSMSGKKIEVLNTDAEGRMVLADILFYTQKIYKPEEMLDFATLTGAIVVALGHTHAGVFTYSKDLANRINNAGEFCGEYTWHMPFHLDYKNDMRNSIHADLKNIGSAHPGATTAAMFLSEFVDTKKCLWAHIDMGGTADSYKETNISRPGGFGYGVMLIDQFIKDKLKK